GGPGNPLSEDALLAKFTANAGGHSPDADELARRIRALADEPDLTAIAALADRLAAPEENACHSKPSVPPRSPSSATTATPSRPAPRTSPTPGCPGSPPASPTPRAAAGSR